jgi:nucleoside-diphosphate-sugar epimerase
MKALITGGAGFISSHLVEALLAAGLVTNITETDIVLRAAARHHPAGDRPSRPRPRCTARTTGSPSARDDLTVLGPATKRRGVNYFPVRK